MEELPGFVALLHDGMARKLHVGAQAYVSLRGETVGDLALGEAAPGVAMTGDSLLPWFSCTKAATAVAVARAWEVHGFDLDDRVADYVPEFGSGGKDEVTVRHLLTHTAGFRWAGGDETGDRVAGWDETLAGICRSRLEPGWVPGRRAGYHPSSSFFVLGEIVHRLDGRPFDRFVREEVFEPLGMDDCWVALDPGRVEAYGDRIGVIHDTSPAAGAPVARWEASSPRALGRCLPGSSGFGPVRQLARLLAMLLEAGILAGSRILMPQTVEAMTARHRVGMRDETFDAVLDWGLGLMVDSRHYGTDPYPYGYGSHASSRTFGHGGRQSSIAFADPEHHLAVAIVANGRPGERANTVRFHALLNALYADLGLVAG